MQRVPDISDANKKAYESDDIVKGYATETELQRPERAVLDILKEGLPGYRMLDVGVGAGRTTRHFAPLVKEYIGTDYSEAMISMCRKMFSFDFRVCDVRRMDVFPDNRFEFVLFSFNGIDNVNRDDRVQALKEIKRVTSPGGTFCFSTHNIADVGRVLAFRMTLNPRGLLKALRKRAKNRAVLGMEGYGDFVVIDDGAHEFRVRTGYVNPLYQVTQLQTLGFHDIRTFGLDGREIMHDELPAARDRWIYYLCKV